MTRSLKALDESEDMLDAIHFFNMHQISCISAMNQIFYLVGIVNSQGVLKAMT